MANELPAGDGKVISGSWKILQNELSLGAEKYGNELYAEAENELPSEAAKYGTMSSLWKVGSMTTPTRKIVSYLWKHPCPPQTTLPPSTQNLSSVLKNIILALFTYMAFVLVGRFPNLVSGPNKWKIPRYYATKSAGYDLIFFPLPGYRTRRHPSKLVSTSLYLFSITDKAL